MVLLTNNTNLYACDRVDTLQLLNGNIRIVNRIDRFTGIAKNDFEMIDHNKMINWEVSNQDNIGNLQTTEFKNRVISHMINDIDTLKARNEILTKQVEILTNKLKVSLSLFPHKGKHKTENKQKIKF